MKTHGKWPLRGLAVAALCCTLAASAACSRIGRSVVGTEQSVATHGPCGEPLPCQPLLLDEPDAVPAAPEPQSSRACDAGCEAAAAAGEGCVARPTTAPRWGDAELATLHCRAAQLQPGAADADDMRLQHVEWLNTDLSVRADTRAVIDITGGRIEHVSLALSGPVTLRLTDVQSISDLRVLAVEGADVQVELLRSEGAGLSVAGAQTDVVLRRSSFSHVRLGVRQITLESSVVADAVFEAQALQAADATLRRIASGAERTLLAGSTVAMARFSRCRSLTAVLGSFRGLHMESCAEEAALYGSGVEQAQLDGRLILDSAKLGRVVFGVGEAAAITAWDSTVADPTFCDSRTALAVGSFGWVNCARCDLAAEPVEPAACVVKGTRYESGHSESCPSLELPEQCSEPQPERMRPPLGSGGEIADNSARP